jgi:AbrB family looped-hinge helix DNA binding protein
VASTRLSTKGQVVLPREVREALNWTPGTELQIDRKGNSVTLSPKAAVPRKDLKAKDVFGVLKWDGEPASIADMNAGVDEMFKREWKR